MTDKIPSDDVTKTLAACMTAGFVAVLFWCCSGNWLPGGSQPATPTSWQNEDSSIGARLIMQQFVSARLKSPSSAEFPDVFDGADKHVTNLGNQRYRIQSYVDSQNGFGAMIRTHFTGEVEQTSEDNWRLLSLDIDEL